MWTYTGTPKCGHALKLLMWTYTATSIKINVDLRWNSYVRKCGHEPLKLMWTPL